MRKFKKKSVRAINNEGKGEKMTKEEILEECQGFIDEICEKFHYDREDTEGNDSLRTVLLKAIPCMLVESSKEDRELFYRMLNHTPIVLIEAGLTREGLEELKEKYIGDVNPHIIEGEKADLGEYGKIVGDSCYIGDRKSTRLNSSHM